MMMMMSVCVQALVMHTQEDVFSVELRAGQPRVMLDLGTSPVLLTTSSVAAASALPSLADGHWHRLDIIWGNEVSLLHVHVPLPSFTITAQIIFFSVVIMSLHRSNLVYVPYIMKKVTTGA